MTPCCKPHRPPRRIPGSLKGFGNIFLKPSEGWRELQGVQAAGLQFSDWLKVS